GSAPPPRGAPAGGWDCRIAHARNMASVDERPPEQGVSPMDSTLTAPRVDVMTARMRGIVDDLRSESPALSSLMLSTLRSSVAPYRLLREPMVEDVYRAGIRNAELWYDCLISGEGPGPDELRWLRAFSRRRNDQAIPLSGLLQAYQVGMKVYMEALLARI